MTLRSNDRERKTAASRLGALVTRIVRRAHDVVCFRWNLFCSIPAANSLCRSEEEGSLQIIPDRRTFLAGLSVWFFVLAAAMAGEELSIDKLEVQAKIPVGGDFMAFGFDLLWMMSGARMMRVNPTDNSVTEIKVDGALGSYRGIAVGEGAI